MTHLPKDRRALVCLIAASRDTVFNPDAQADASVAMV